ncbi:MAG: type VI secretion system ImpA family N-terminal domain-containing protein [Deltaproteobacteria bacterium]|nr:type VI secretion system ImpA family N-terminal domain-containing protein [Deltaproteobacteria bacterium]
MSQEELEIQASIWCQAISESAFCGQPSRYEDDYELILNEITKLESVHGEEPAWQEVRRAADALTREKTKDMTILTALCVAEAQLSGVEALAPAIYAFRFLVENHSKEMFPNAARRRGRGGTFGWMIRNLEAPLTRLIPSSHLHQTYLLLQEQFLALDDRLREELQDEHPTSRPVRDQLERLIAATPPEVPVQSVEEETPSEHSPAPLQPMNTAAAPPKLSGVPQQIDSEEQADAALKMAVTVIKKTAQFFITRREDRAVGYTLAHAASMLEGTPIWEPLEPITELITKARQVTESQGLTQGCKVLQEALKGAGTKIMRFRLRVALADLCTDHGEPEVAQPLLANLKEETEAPMTEWLPDLMVELARATVSCQRKLSEQDKDDGDIRRDAEEMMDVLSRLAPGLAFEMK